MPLESHSAQPIRRAPSRAVALLVCLLSIALLPLGAADGTAAAGIDHLVVSEVVTGGASASDEMIELYNPSPVALPLEGLELVYVTASGATITRRAAWSLGAPEMAPGTHLLVANELGVFASIADSLYATGMAATGGSVSLRIQGASSAIDAVGWGTAASAWMEGAAAPAPPAGSSLERLPGGTSGSTVDTDNNLADFAIRAVPDPQNAGSPPVPDPSPPTPSAQPTATPTSAPTPSPTATLSPTTTPSPTATPSPTPAPSGEPTPTAIPTPTPSGEPTATPTASAAPTGSPLPTPISIAAARALADGSTATIEGVALTASDFHDGGGYLADATGGIAVLVDGGAFGRGERLLVSGTIDDRFAQRTLRAVAGALVVTGSGQDPAPITRPTGGLDETVEAALVRIEGAIDGNATLLSGGLAFDVDDGSGAARVVAGTATGIDTSAWSDGRRLAIVGVVGQRDSSGTGSSGYRLQPRDAGDVEVLPDPSPSPSPSGSAGPDPSPTVSPSPSPSPSAGADVITIVEARSAPKNARVVIRGVVTLASGTIDPGSAVVQDASGAILLRLSDDAGELTLGQLVEVDGVRSTKAGMESVRVTVPPQRLGTATDPVPRAVRTGNAGEDAEAQLVVVRGALTASARRASSGTVSFELDDGSGPLRVVLGSTLAPDDEALVGGSWVEVTGVLGQETTGALPMRGYRVWPRDASEVRILAAATNADATASERQASGRAARSSSSSLGSSLDAVGAGGPGAARIGATLVVGEWPELGLAGLLWDGQRLLGIAPSSGDRLDGALGELRPPVALELGGLEALRRDERLGITVAALGDGVGDTVPTSGRPSPPRTRLPGPGADATWVSLVGRLSGTRERRVIAAQGSSGRVDVACDRAPVITDGLVNAVGIALVDPARLVVPCEGIRRASTLALVGGAASVRRVSGAPAATGLVVSGDAPLEGRRGVAAGLLAAGVALIAAAALLRRRLEPTGGGEGVGDADDPDAERAPSGPQLTLVRVPHERGP